jgi:hypothetical protein
MSIIFIRQNESRSFVGIDYGRVEMLFSVIGRLAALVRSNPKVSLGRWGYHWDTYKDIQKYYD